MNKKNELYNKHIKQFYLFVAAELSNEENGITCYCSLEIVYKPTTLDRKQCGTNTPQYLNHKIAARQDRCNSFKTKCY